MHRGLFHKFFDKKYEELRQYVDSEFAGGDLLFSYVLAQELGPHSYRALCPEERYHTLTAETCSENTRPSNVRGKHQKDVLYDVDSDMLVEYDSAGVAKAKISWKMTFKKRRIIRKIFGSPARKLHSIRSLTALRKARNTRMWQSASDFSEDHKAEGELCTHGGQHCRTLVGKSQKIDDVLGNMFKVPSLVDTLPLHGNDDFVLRTKVSDFQTYFANSIIWERQTRYYMDFWRWLDRMMYTALNEMDCKSAPWRTISAKEFWYMQRVH